MILRAPFPWFGGKSRCANIVWRAFGNTPNYVEPFFGSGAVLLGRPHESKIETVNDVDCFLSCFWRAVVADPDAVAAHCDWPVNEADLHARHKWLVAHALTSDFRDRMRREPEYFDAKVAGWWVWGLSMWIGSGWCQLPREGQTSRSARGVVHEKRPDCYARGTGKGVHRKAMADGKTPRLTSNITGRARPRHRGTVAWNSRPDLDGIGQGVHKKLSTKRPNTGNTGEGVHALEVVGQKQQKPGLQGAGRGISAPTRMPNIGSERGVLGTREGRWADGAPRTEDGPPCREWFRALQARLRRVRVCCGDWERVLTDSVIGTTRSRNSGMNPCAVFLDPPYSDEERARDLYSVDDGAVSARVAAWAIAHGDDPDLRIALCGYAGEHEMPATWQEYEWKATRGYAAEDNGNRGRERIWFSPHCLPIEAAQGSLFAGGLA